MNTVHVVAPDGLDDPTRPSGGNRYNRRLLDELRATGWDVRVHVVGGSWPLPDHIALEQLISVVIAIPDDALLLIDGLIASVVPAVLATHADRLRLVALVHIPLGDHPPGHGAVDARTAERAMLTVAGAIVTTSGWTRDRLVELYQLPSERIFVARPGVEPAPVAPGSGDGASLLCVGAIAVHKGHDVLVAALAGLRDVPWRCMVVGPLDREPAYVDEVVRASANQPIVFHGPQSGVELDRSFADADVLVVASRYESYGMVITEALARGTPVIASSVGGVPEAMTLTPDGRRPGILVPADDADALRMALREWLADEGLRYSLRATALEVRPTLAGWEATAGIVAQALTWAGHARVNHGQRESVFLGDSFEGVRSL